MMKWNRGLWALGAAAVGCLVLAGTAAAFPTDVSTERSGSIVVFPKVVWDGTRDTVIQISSTSNMVVQARCFYINAAPLNPAFPPSPFNPSQWAETDFDLFLTKQQPTHWVASQGRPNNFLDPFASDGSGFDSGPVPPVPLGFKGELKCVEVGDDLMPMRGNALKGEATLRRRDGDVSKYNAIAFQGNTDLGVQEGTDVNDLVLDLTSPNPAMAIGGNNGEYSACPDVLILNHFISGVPDLVVSQLGTCNPVCFGGPHPGTSCDVSGDCGIGGQCQACPVSTEITLVPCGEDLENGIPGRVTAQFHVFNEFEQEIKVSTTVDCFLETPLTRIASIFGSAGNVGSLTAQTRINPVDDPAHPNGGLIGIAEEIRLDTGFGVEGFGQGATTVASYNMQIEGNRFDAATDSNGTAPDNFRNGVTDHIILPAP